MEGMLRKATRFLILFVGLFLAVAPAFAQKKPKVVKAPPQPASADSSAEPDKVLYDRAMGDIKHGRYTEGRLALQTLINTYPDSEYLAKAKLAVADSYFKEGGTSNLTQAIAEYQDFTTFFPFLEEAAYAQMQIGMSHYKMMEKADRDDEQALDAEDAFQAFILKYPQSPLVPQAEQRLRDVQEVLAQGEFEIAHYYYTKPDYRAAAARLVELTQRYPLYSGSDEALFMLGDIYQRARVSVKNEDEKNHWADLSARCYDRIVTDYPMSKHAADAKRRLQEMGMPVPTADPAAYERMAKEQKLEESQEKQGFFFDRETSLKRMSLSVLNSRPDVSQAAHTGAPNLNPPDDAVSATEVLRPDAPGPQFNLAAQTPGGAGDAGATQEGGSQVDVSPGGTIAASGTGVGAQIISTGGATASDPPPATTTSSGSSNMSPDVQTITPQPVTGNDSAPAPSASPAPPPAAKNSSDPPASSSSPAPAPASASSSAATSSGSSAAPADSSGSGSSSSSESTSKKKKGLRKLIPF